MADALPELLQFPRSPYNEKARWALDLKQIPHRRRNLIPGPHAPVVLWLTGKTQVPVLRMDGEVLDGSATILEALEQLQPEPRLFPEDPAQRERALEIQRYFDEEVGPPLRRALFAAMLPTPAYLVRVFAGSHGLPVRLAYRASLPLVSQIMRRSMQVTPEKVEEAQAAIREGLEFVVKHAGPDGHLVGDHFSVADLTAASILAPLAEPDHPDMSRPNPKPERLVRFLESWSRHPGIAWVHETYRRYRPTTSAEVP